MSAPALEVTGLHVDYGRSQVLTDLHLRVEEGSITCLLGANGAGKSTTIRAVSGMLGYHGGRITAGRVRFLGEDVGDATSTDIVGRGLAVVPEGRRVFADMTVRDNLRVGGSHRRDRGVDDDIERVFARFPVLGDRRASRAGYLSGGEQQMLAIGRALMARPRVMLLDEPSLGLAPIVAKQVIEVVDEIRRDGCTVLLVEQNVERGLGVSDHAYVLEQGRVTVSGPAAEVRRDEGIARSYLGLGVQGGQA